MLLVKLPAEGRQKKLDSYYDPPLILAGSRYTLLESRVGGAKTSRVMGQAMRPQYIRYPGG